MKKSMAWFNAAIGGVLKEGHLFFFFNFMLPRMKLSDIGTGSYQNKAR